MPTDDREKQFERALARHLRNAPHAAACPDTEILAAYHERTLSLEEAAHWKQHIAACSRCQEILSLLEETAAVPANEWEEQNVPVFAGALNTEIPLRASAGRAHAREESALPAVAAVTAAPAKVPLRLHSWRWAAPLGALAAGLLVWVGLHETRMFTKQVPVEIALNRKASPPTSTTLSATPTQHESTQLSQPPTSPKVGSRNEIPSPSAKLVAPAMNQLASRANAPRPPADQSEVADKLVASEQKQPQEIAPGKSAPARPAARASSEFSAVAKMPPAPSPGFSAGAGTGPAVGGKQPESARKKDLQQNVQESVEVSGAAVAVASSSSELQKPSLNYSSAQLDKDERGGIIAAGKKNVWRVGAAGKIELTADGGKTWDVQASPAVTDLTAGSAPSDKVCWVVGKAGTVLLTTDGGKSWTLRNSPIPDDLGGIHAVDASHATIWDLPNRRSFVTADGGATWTQTGDR